MKVLIACGGTGGHIFPGLSLAQELNDRKTGEVLLVGTDHPLEVKLFGSFGLPYRLLPAAKIPSNPMKFLGFLARFTIASSRAIKLLFEFKPDVVVGLGGYASFPICVFASISRAPLFLHEQNRKPGLANKVLAFFARTVAVSFKDTAGEFKRKAVFTGNPIRKKLLAVERQDALRLYGLSGEKFTVLILGGSQGSSRINEIIFEMLGLLNEEEKNRIQIIHVAGNLNYDAAREKYEGCNVDSRVYDFVDEIESAYAASDMVISRAGATALFEIAALGIPSIMIPYRYAGRHQYHNAFALEEAGAAVVMDEDGLSAAALKEKIFELKDDKAKLKEMSACAKKFAVPDAAARLADLICDSLSPKDGRSWRGERITL